MRGLDITGDNLKNQQGVVSNEVKVNVLNRPYGGFPWLDMPQYANTNFYNSHNFYGDLKDVEAATLPDVAKFFETYYAPNNAALVVVGDFAIGDGKAMIAKYFSEIPSHPQPAAADLTEPRQEKEKRASKSDALAKRPALAFAYHMPERGTPEYYAMGLLDQILAEGDDSLLKSELVNRKAFTGEVSGGINLLGNMLDYRGPMLWTVALYHDSNVSADQIMSSVDAVIASVREKELPTEVVNRAKVKWRSDFYDAIDSGFGRADLLASLALFDDRPSRINEIEPAFEKVTPALILKTAQEYLRPANRTVLTVLPVKGDK